MSYERSVAAGACAGRLGFWAFGLASMSTPYMVLFVNPEGAAASGTWLMLASVPLGCAMLLLVRHAGRAERATRTALSALDRARSELCEAHSRRDWFLAVLSHELRNPLTPICNCLHVLDHAAPGGEQARRAKEIIDRQTAHLRRLVDDLLDISRMTKDKLPIAAAKIDLVALARGVVDDYRSFFESRGVELDVSTPSSPLWLSGDASRLMQVLGGLLHNAAKFTPAGGRAKLCVEEGANGRQAIVRVSDTGEGIGSELLSGLFKPFVQADTSLARSRGGLGLGLALAKGLIEMHGGTIEARSAGLGEGSEFIVRLPLLVDAAPPVKLVSLSSGEDRGFLEGPRMIGARDALRAPITVHAARMHRRSAGVGAP